ncbi:hypothetical protein AVEN_217972-1 [Araneus ventricosus]|uniref:Uncharacterized protein n=1 Tax=Araneus ventricosus TaxID=182803 RepID=A0A4Y2DL31_ARAVE|nr:hypothetical protein AVEN_217972-1 [Araneus ventricosus]
MWIQISKDFRSQRKKLKLLNYLSTSIKGTRYCRDYTFEVLHCEDKAPTVCQLTDAEICSMVLMNSKAFSEKKHKRKIKCQLTASWKC